MVMRGEGYNREPAEVRIATSPCEGKDHYLTIETKSYEEVKDNEEKEWLRRKIEWIDYDDNSTPTTKVPATKLKTIASWKKG